MTARDELSEIALVEISRAQREAVQPDLNPKLMATALMLAAITAPLNLTCPTKEK